MDIEFAKADTWHWNADRHAVEFEAIAGEEIIEVFVARTFIEARWGAQSSTPALLATAKAHCDTVVGEARHLITIGATQNGEIHIE